MRSSGTLRRRTEHGHRDWGPWWFEPFRVRVDPDGFGEQLGGEEKNVIESPPTERSVRSFLGSASGMN